MSMGQDLKEAKINEIRLESYSKTINQIDDYFEYRYKSKEDQEFVVDLMNKMSRQIRDKVAKL